MANGTPPVRDTIARMAGYAPGEQLNDPEVLKLNTNELPYPPSPAVFAAIQAACTGDGLRKYPQPAAATFRQVAAGVLGVPPEMILAGNGSDDLLTILTRAFVPEGGLMVSPAPSYTLYRSLAEIQGARFEVVPFTGDWQLPEPWPHPDADLTFLPNPNSPSGTLVPLEAVERLARQLRGTLVLDEAYVDFAERHGLGLASRLPNVVVTRSFSKYYALAGVRFGYAVARPEVIAELVKVKDSYNCDVLSLAAATAAIADQDYYAGTRRRIIESRDRLSAGLVELGFAVTPSRANFVWCAHPSRPHDTIANALRGYKILVRHMRYGPPAQADGLRITVGSEAEVGRLLAALREVLAR